MTKYQKSYVNKYVNTQKSATIQKSSSVTLSRKISKNGTRKPPTQGNLDWLIRLFRRLGNTQAVQYIAKNPQLRQYYDKLYKTPIVQSQLNSKEDTPQKKILQTIFYPKIKTDEIKSDIKLRTIGELESEYKNDKQTQQTNVVQGVFDMFKPDFKTRAEIKAGAFNKVPEINTLYNSKNRILGTGFNVYDKLNNTMAQAQTAGNFLREMGKIDASKENRLRYRNVWAAKDTSGPKYVQYTRDYRRPQERENAHKGYLDYLKDMWDRAKTYDAGTTATYGGKNRELSENYASGLGLANRLKPNIATREQLDKEATERIQMARDYLKGKFKPKTITDKTAVNMGLKEIERKQKDAAKQTQTAIARTERDRKRSQDMVAQASSMRSPQPNKTTSSNKPQPTPQPVKTTAQNKPQPKKVVAQKSPYQLQLEAQARNRANLTNRITAGIADYIRRFGT